MKTYRLSLYGRQGSMPVAYDKILYADSLYVNDGDLTFFVREDTVLTNTAAFAKGQWIHVEIVEQGNVKEENKEDGTTEHTTETV
jgi:hypothetical protein